MKKIALDEFCNLRYPSNLKFSPNGKRLCFVLTNVNKKDNCYESCIYELKGKKMKQITSGKKERSFMFLDDDTILFASDRDNSKEPSIESKFYKISLSGGEAVKAFSIPVPVEKLLPLPSGDFIAVVSTFPGFEDLYKGDKKRISEYLEYSKENADYETVEQVPFWWNGSTFTKGAYSSICYYNVKKNKLEMLTEKGFWVSDVKLNNDKSEIWFFGSEVKPFTKIDDRAPIYRIKLSDKKVEKIVDNSEKYEINNFEFGKSFVLLSASDKKHGLNTDSDFYKLSYDDHKITFYKEYGEGLHSSVGSDVRFGGGYGFKMVDDALYFISTIFDCANLYKLEDGKITKITKKEGSVDSFDIYGDKIRTISLFDMKALEIYDENDERLTSTNEKALSDKYVSIPEKLNFETSGHEIHGFVLKPFDYEEGKKYPIILDIHGGPKTVYGPVFYHEMQYWTSLGYFVIYCNPTGSDGRNEFADIRGKYGTVDFDDIMAFCDEALKKYPDMDEKNFFETGGSYGGFMTNWIIGHTDRFSACASQRSISNWFSFYGVSDIGVDFSKDQCDADIWDSPEKLWWHSPLKYANKCKTPTLFIHSFEDYRCPIDQGYQMYTSLVAHGVEAKMILFRGENHELSRSGKPLHRIKRLDEITKWFENHKK